MPEKTLRAGSLFSGAQPAASTLPSMLPLALSLLGCASPTSTPDGCSNGTGPASPSTETCGTSGRTPHESTYCTAATRVNHSAKQADAAGPMTHDISGLPCSQPFAFYDPDSSSVRTCQDTLLSDSSVSSLIFPASGCMSGGWLYELPTLVRPIDGHDCSGLLGTPSAADAAGTRERRGGKRSNELLLKGQVKAMMPTPTVTLLPTPRTTDAHGTGDHGTGGRDLRTEISLLPTLTDAVVRTQFGVVTNPRFNDGSTPPEPERHGQLMIGDD